MQRTRRGRFLLLGTALLAGGAMPIFLNLTAATSALRRRASSPEERQAATQRTGRLYARWVLLPGLGLLGGITGYSTRNARALANRVLVGAAAGLLGALELDAVRWWAYNRGFTGKENPETQAGRFGHMILGPEAADPQARATGYAYHMLNGVGFGITYSLLAGPARWAWGPAWGATIWLLNMVSPPTLVTGAGPFLHRRGWRPATVSLAAHLAFGAVVGAAVRAWARPRGTVLDLLAEPTS